MRRGKDFKGVCILLLCFTIVIASSFTRFAHARRSTHHFKSSNPPRNSVIKPTKKLQVTKHFDMASLLLRKATMGSSNTSPYVSSPFTLPPYDSLPPTTLPGSSPPYCSYPPNSPQSPSTPVPNPPFYYLPPTLPLQSPPPGPETALPTPPEYGPTPNPPEAAPSPPSIVPNPPVTVPSPTIYVPSPPRPILRPPYYKPSPPIYTRNPPISVPSPTGFVPSPTVFLPPVVYPPPTGPPPPRTSSPTALWCVAKPSVPDPIIQEALNYACGSGADCDSIQPSGSCFQPNTLFAHASYAFNSYWQRSKTAGSSCSFGGIAMLVTVDPSYEGCQFAYN